MLKLGVRNTPLNSYKFRVSTEAAAPAFPLRGERDLPSQDRRLPRRRNPYFCKNVGVPLTPNSEKNGFFFVELGLPRLLTPSTPLDTHTPPSKTKIKGLGWGGEI